ncbi:MAG: hypothetical protein PHN82_09025 [bacterium]|nr:hypothetical protein [bacterium]
MRVREIVERDIERLRWIESIAWRNGVQFDGGHFRSQRAIFPEGQLCFEDGQGQIWGLVNLMKIRFDPRRPLDASWSEITADGYITTHDPRGNWLFGVNLAVHPHGYFIGAAEALIEAAARRCAYMHLRGIALVGRMPGYARWLRERARAGHRPDGAALRTASEYMEMRVRGSDGTPRRLDPELGLYESFGLRILAPIPRYIPDRKSHDFGIAMVWSNFLYFPFYLCPSRRVWKKIVCGTAGRALGRIYLRLVSGAQGAGARVRGLSPEPAP